ncbi:MAG: glycosyltransferase family 4 protein [Patescibacteria group bacterium]|nr:glycosyltransferase family 4 protein [Patescibacteria group bacterium]
MNIALFSLTYGALNGEGGIAADELISRLRSSNFNIFTYKYTGIRSFSDEKDNFNITIAGNGDSKKRPLSSGNKLAYFYSAWQSAERAHRVKRFDAIWAIGASYGGLAALLFKTKHPKLPLLLTIQDDADISRPLFAKRIIKMADLIQCNSQYLADVVAKMGARCPIEVISGGVDIDLFQTKYSDQEIKSLRNNLDIKEDYVILTTARLVRKNGIDVLIKAVVKLKEKRPGIKLLVIGEGPEIKRLKVQSKKLKTDINVLFLGLIPHKDLPLYFRISDVFVSPARFGGSGNSLLESMAARIPVVATPEGGSVDFLRDKENGFFCKTEDSDDMSDKINFVLGHIDERKKVVANAENLVNKYYLWDVISEKMEEVFRRLVAK